VRDIIFSHLESLYAFYGEETGVRVARKHLGWYWQKLSDAPDIRAELMAAPATALQFAAAKRGLDAWADCAVAA
jgi:tRNA-dihydrouridine synthase B